MKDYESDILIEQSREIFAFGEIDVDFARKICKDILYLKHQKNAPITIYLNSDGGCITSAISIYDLISSLPFEVTIVGMGYVCSAASFLIQAADKRLMTENSVMMLHHMTISNEDRLDVVRSTVEISEKMWDRVVSIYINKTGRTKNNIEKLLSKDWYLTCTEAIEENLIDDRL